jgi:GAF domain-containing protein
VPDALPDAGPVVDELGAVYARIAGLLLSHETVETVLRLITALAVETVPGAWGSGVTLVDARGRKATAAATDREVERADALQYELGEGPCLAAWAGRSTVAVEDVASEQRWPRWAARVRDTRLRSSLSAPLVAGDASLGALKVYGSAPGTFDTHAERLVTLFAAQAAILVANVQTQENARRASERLKAALRTRDAITQAKGLLMGSRGVDAETAFALLVAAAQRENKQLHQVAGELVDSANRRRRGRHPGRGLAG